jgi:hypothetical protein
VQLDPVTGEGVPDRGGTTSPTPSTSPDDDATGWHLAAMAVAAVLAGAALWTLLAGLARLMATGVGRRGEPAAA